MARPVIVDAAFDIFDSEGNVAVAAGTRGTVIAATIPPQAARFQVEFLAYTGTTTVWAAPGQLTFLDGKIGEARAIISSEGAFIVDIDFVELMSDVDLVVNNSLTFNQNKIDLITNEPGYVIRITANPNGDLDIANIYIGE